MSVDLRLGDCLEILPTLADSSVDLILTDPPYYKVKGDAWDRQWDTPQGFLDWMDKVLEQYYRILKPNGSLYVFASPKMAARVELLISNHFNVLQRITWAKPEYSTKAEMNPKQWQRLFFPVSEAIIFAEHYGADGYAKGEAGYSAKCDELRGFVFEPLRAYLDGERERAGATKGQVDAFMGNFMSGHYFTQSQWALPTQANYEKLRQCLANLNHGGEYLKRDYEELRQQYEELRQQYEELRQQYEDLRRPFSVTASVPYTDVWTFKTVSAYPGKHPCEKPLEMLEHIIKASSRAGAIVLDSFMGTGNTGIAAQKLGRDFIGIEKDAKYFTRAETRIKQSQMVMAL